MLIHNTSKNLFVYSTEPILDQKSLNDNDKTSIKEYYYKIKDPLSKIVFKDCPKPSKMENRFVFTIAYALCIAKGLELKTFFNINC